MIARTATLLRGDAALSAGQGLCSDIIIDWVRHHLVEHQHPEKSGFTPNRSTIHHILALRVLTERRQKFWQGLLAADVDLCKAFDSVNQDTLWRSLDLRRVPP